MLVKNFGDYSYGNSEFVGLQKNEKYWFPNAFKYIAWCIVIVSVLSSSVVLLLYGMSFGMIKTYLWATAFGASFLIGIFITAPIRILFFTCLNSIFLKKAPIILRRKIPLSLLSNPLNKRKKYKVLKYRKYNANLYAPTPVCKLQSRFEDIKHNIELRNLTIDVIANIVFMISVCYFVLINKTEMGFYNNKIVSELILSGAYTDSIPFAEVRTYDMFLKYLNETLLPALLLESPKNVTKEKSREFSKRISSESNNKRKRQIIGNLNNDDFKERVFEKGWTMNHCLKLMGKPRLRQVRVKGSCKYLKKLKPRNKECAPELNLFNVESGSFTLGWEPAPPGGLTKLQKLPWTYQSAWATKTLPVFGKFSQYPGGGYVLDLARHINDARLILNFIDEFRWVDIKTRAVFIEFTLYNVNVNLFSVITLIFEMSATGYIIPSHQIHTCKFIFVAHELEYISIAMIGLFTLLLFFFLLRESVRIHKTSFKIYIGWTFAVLDLVIIIFGALTFIFLILRTFYVSLLLKQLEKANNNEFVSFIYAACWHFWSVYVEAILVLLAAFKFLRLLTFRVIFYQIQATLNHCYKYFLYLSALQLIFLVAFANFFYFTLVNYSEKFSSFGNSLSTLFGRGVAYDDTFDLNLLSRGFSVLTPFFFWLFVLVVALLFVNVFIAITCLYFHVVRQVPLTNKYNILDYIKFYLTKKHQKDILNLKYKEKIMNDEKDSDVMRLKGGGIKLSTKMKNAEEEGNFENEKVEMGKILLKDFIKENIYETIKYFDVKENRVYAMRNLVASFLTNDENERMLLREKAMKILYCNLISIKKGKKREDPNGVKGPYFSVVKKSETEIIDKRMFLKMRKIVENVGKEKGWFLDDVCHNKVPSVEEKLILLDKKLNLLLKKIPQK